MKSEDENNLDLVLKALGEGKHALGTIKDKINEALNNAPFPVVVDNIHEVMDAYYTLKNELDVQLKLIGLLKDKR